MVNIVAVVKEGVKTAIEHPIQSLKAGANAIFNSPTPKNTASFVVPMSFPSPSAGAKAGVNIVSKAGGLVKQGVSSAYKAITTAKLPSPKTWIAGTAGLIGMHTAFKAARSSITGEKFSPVPNFGDVLRSGAGALSPFGAGMGATAGLLEVLGKKAMPNPRMPWEQPVNYGKSQASDLELAQDKLKNFIDVQVDKIPNMNMPFQLPSTSTNISLPAMTMPSTSITMPSMNVSGGGGGLDMAMLALLLGGAGGYLVGRKRKKKRYKKRRKH